MKIALVHDDLIQFGGAEKLLLAIHEIWPEAPVFTSMASKDWVGKCHKEKIELRTSFMQKLPFKGLFYRAYFLLYPLALESFNFDKFDVVISSSARFAHGVITKPETAHICYMNTPGRMWWESKKYFGQKRLLRWLLSPFLNYLRLWDYTAAQRVDFFIANSKTPQARIKKYFGRESAVIYPFANFRDQVLDTTRLPARQGKQITENPPSQRLRGTGSKQRTDEYFLVVTRLVAWKQVDIAIEACKSLGQNLIIVGEGPDRGRLEALAAGRDNIKLLGKVNEETLVDQYQNCQAVIITQEEDFGMVAVEAAAYHKPVIAYKAGGSVEIVTEGLTGTFFEPQDASALENVLSGFNEASYLSTEDYDETCKRFCKDKFTHDLRNFVEKVYAEET